MSLTHISLKGALLWQNLVRLAPAVQIVNDGVAPASCYDPHHIFVAIIDFLVFSVGGYEGKVPRCKLLSAGAVRTAYDGTVAACSVDNGIWTCIR